MGGSRFQGDLPAKGVGDSILERAVRPLLFDPYPLRARGGQLSLLLIAHGLFEVEEEEVSSIREVIVDPLLLRDACDGGEERGGTCSRLHVETPRRDCVCLSEP